MVLASSSPQHTSAARAAADPAPVAPVITFEGNVARGDAGCTAGAGAGPGPAVAPAAVAPPAEPSVRPGVLKLVSFLLDALQQLPMLRLLLRHAVAGCLSC